MTEEATFDHPNWYVVQTHPKQEDRAADNLTGWNIEVLNPKIKSYRRNSFTGELTYFSKPLFPNYIFAKFAINSLYHKLRFTRGVRGLLSFGDYPTPVHETIISLIRSRIGEDGLIDIGEKFTPGQSVMIKEGPLQNLVGVFEQDVKGSIRVMILLQTV